MRTRFAKILDAAIIAAAVFALSYLIARYYLSLPYAALVIAAAAAAGAAALIRLKNKRNAETERDNYRAALTAEHFLYRGEEYALNYFFDALRTRYDVAKKRKYLKINSTLIAVSLSEPLAVKQTVKYYADAKRENAKTLVILTAEAQKNACEAARRLTDLRLEIFLKDRTYRLLKSLDRIPEPDKRRGPSKRKELLLSAFNPKRFKGYMLAFFALLTGAAFSVWPLYFMITAAAALTMAVLCRLGIDESLKKKGAEKNPTGKTSANPD